MGRPANMTGGLQGQEIDIMRLWDDGLSIEQIAAHLGKRRAGVTVIVTRLSGLRDKADIDWRADLRAASAQLLDAVTRVHGRHAA